METIELDVPLQAQMNSMNHETRLDLRLAGSKEFGLLLKLIFYNSFVVIIRFPRPFNQRNCFKTQFHAIVSLVEKTFQTANKKGRAERKLLRLKMSSGATPYAVRTLPGHSASLDQNFSHRWATIFFLPRMLRGRLRRLELRYKT